MNNPGDTSWTSGSGRDKLSAQYLSSQGTPRRTGLISRRLPGRDPFKGRSAAEVERPAGQAVADVGQEAVRRQPVGLLLARRGRLARERMRVGAGAVRGVRHRWQRRLVAVVPVDDRCGAVERV